MHPDLTSIFFINDIDYGLLKMIYNKFIIRKCIRILLFLEAEKRPFAN